MEPDVAGARRYRPLHRTPPEYQTVIKCLLMASILDTVWVSGPPRTGSPCALVGSEGGDPPGQRPGQRPSPVTPPSPAPLPLEVQDALRKLNISVEDCVRRPDSLRMASVAPTAMRVFSILLFNAFVFWSDFGAALFGSATPPVRRGGQSMMAPPGSFPLTDEMSFGDMASEKTPWNSEVPVNTWATGEAATFKRVASSECYAVAVEKCSTLRSANGNVTSSLSDEAGVGKLCSSVLRTGVGPAKGAPSEPDAEEYEVHVPWLVQLFYIVMLVVMIVSMPCCPAVFENACTFLMC
ncbi:Putative zinc metalloprotease mll0638 [Frankliniella fusca]|uniref:Zinc metalloprotease mll0638 n=1 Tax=Frankliniella fusca TaxID=407009 RepID=A0AAE1HSX6_9NEOP|nr:Putative zinc metalloprotease mll0638 [Frankliniella fusca]